MDRSDVRFNPKDYESAAVMGSPLKGQMTYPMTIITKDKLEAMVVLGAYHFGWEIKFQPSRSLRGGYLLTLKKAATLAKAIAALYMNRNTGEHYTIDDSDMDLVQEIVNRFARKSREADNVFDLLVTGVGRGNGLELVIDG